MLAEALDLGNWIALFAAVVALGALVVTVIQTCIAKSQTGIAEEANRHAGKAAQAASDANEHARRSADAAERALADQARQVVLIELREMLAEVRRTDSGLAGYTALGYSDAKKQELIARGRGLRSEATHLIEWISNRLDAKEWTPKEAPMDLPDIRRAVDKLRRETAELPGHQS